MARMLLALFVLAIAGCASQPAENVTLIKEPDALAELATTAVITSERLMAIHQLLEEERQKQTLEEQRQAAINAAYVPDGFEIKGSMKTRAWPDVVCTRLAQLAGYETSTVIGDRPKAPFLVDINKRNVPLWELVHELGQKTGKAFVMEVYENTKLVRCVYARPEA